MSIDEKAREIAYIAFGEGHKISEIGKQIVDMTLEAYEAAKKDIHEPCGYEECCPTVQPVELRTVYDKHLADAKRTNHSACGCDYCEAMRQAPMRESGEETVPKWSLDSQIQISNDLRYQLSECQRKLSEKSDYELMNTPMTRFDNCRPLTKEEGDEIFKALGCDECGCSINFHAPRCSKSTKIEDQEGT